MPSQPYIPRSDENFRNWAFQFAHEIHRNPASFMIAPSQADFILAQFNAYNAAHEKLLNPDTATAPNIIAKQNARSILESTCRQFAALIKVNLGVSDEAKVAIGVPPINPTRHRRWCPQVPPTLVFIDSTPGIDTLRVINTLTKGKAKPYGAERLELWIAHSEVGGPPPKLEDAKLFQAFRKADIRVPIDPKYADKRPTYWGRWLGFNDDVGPWSQPCSMAIAAKAKAEKDSKSKSKANESDDEDQSLKMAA